MRSSDIWLFRVGAAVVTYAVVVYGGREVGRRLHEQEALEKAHRVRSEAEDKTDALWLAAGFKDTQGYREMESKLTLEERNQGFVEPHFLEKQGQKLGAGLGLVIAFLCGESARVWAAKREAGRRISARYKKP